jgi:hypothetical protein
MCRNDIAFYYIDAGTICAAIKGDPPSRSVTIALAKVTKAKADEGEIAFTI